MGSVEKGLVNSGVAQQFRDATLHNKRECNSCWVRYYCSGGCHANAFLCNESLYEPDALGCKMEKIRIETALTIAAKEGGGRD